MVGGEIPFNRRNASPSELDYVRQCLESGHVAGDGPFTARATASLARLLGAPVLLTTSCTHALELAALLVRIAPGDEVVVPSFTFSSTANAFALRGARIRFADVSPETFSMEAPELEAALTDRTTAVCAVAYGGVNRDIAAIVRLCRDRSISLIEDAAQALFATSGGQALGTFGCLGALSFHSTKNVSCGEGGALILNDRSLESRALTLREKGTDRTRFLRGEVDRYTWQEIGSSYLPSDVLAAILAAQLEHASVLQRRRHEIWSIYRSRLGEIAARREVRLQHIPGDAEHPAHLFAIVLPPELDLDRTLGALRARGVCAATHFQPLHRAPAASGERPDLPVTDDLARGLLRLPLFGDMSLEDAGRVADAVAETLEAS